MSKSLFVVASKQHIGKTTVSLSLMNHYIKKFNKVGYIKPIGQKHVMIDNVKVDKDIRVFKRYFDLKTNVNHMSPFVIGSMTTRKSIDDSTIYYFQVIEIGHFIILFNAKNINISDIGIHYCRFSLIIGQRIILHFYFLSPFKLH